MPPLLLRSISHLSFGKFALPPPTKLRWPLEYNTCAIIMTRSVNKMDWSRSVIFVRPRCNVPNCARSPIVKSSFMFREYVLELYRRILHGKHVVGVLVPVIGLMEYCLSELAPCKDEENQEFVKSPVNLMKYGRPSL